MTLEEFYKAHKDSEEWIELSHRVYKLTVCDYIGVIHSIPHDTLKRYGKCKIKISNHYTLENNLPIYEVDIRNKPWI